MGRLKQFLLFFLILSGGVFLCVSVVYAQSAYVGQEQGGGSASKLYNVPSTNRPVSPLYNNQTNRGRSVFQPSLRSQPGPTNLTDMERLIAQDEARQRAVIRQQQAKAQVLLEQNRIESEMAQRQIEAEIEAELAAKEEAREREQQAKLNGEGAAGPSAAGAAAAQGGQETQAGQNAPKKVFVVKPKQSKTPKKLFNSN